MVANWTWYEFITALASNMTDMKVIGISSDIFLLAVIIVFPSPLLCALISYIATWSASRFERGRVHIFGPTPLTFSRSERYLRDGRNFVHCLLVTVSLIDGHFSVSNGSRCNAILAAILDTIQSRVGIVFARICNRSNRVRQTSPKSRSAYRAWDWESCRELPRFNGIVSLAIWWATTVK